MFTTDPPIDDRFQVWCALDHWAARPLAAATYTLTGPLPATAVVRSAQTDEHGDLREQDLSCGEYRLEIAGGAAIVAARWIVEPQSAAAGPTAGWECWPDAIRVRDARTDARPAESPQQLEPGAPISKALATTLDWLWTEDDLEVAEIADCANDEDMSERVIET